MKMKTNFNFGALNSSGRRRFSLKKGNPNWVKIISLSASLAALLGVAGCALVQNNEQPVTSTTPTAQVQNADETKDEKAPVEETDEYSLLIDQLNISNLHMVDNLTPKIEAEVQAQLEALVPEGGTVIDSSNVYIAPDGSGWESEEAYLKHINSQNEKGTGETVKSGYEAPDGTVWTSEAEYLKYIAGQNTGDNGTGTNVEDTKVEGNFYLAPDGSGVWESEEAYLEYIKGSQNTGLYEAPDGSVWESEEAYLEYTKESQNTGLYEAPDGSVWESEQSYLDSLEIKTPAEGEKGQGSGEYIAPDGERWESKEMYDEYIKSLSDETPTDGLEEPVTEWTEEETGDETFTEEGVSVIPESEYVAEPKVEQTVDNSNYYVDEYGNYWASYEDYVDYMQMMAQEENGKHR